MYDATVVENYAPALLTTECYARRHNYTLFLVDIANVSVRRDECNPRRTPSDRRVRESALERIFIAHSADDHVPPALRASSVHATTRFYRMVAVCRR